MKTTVINFYGGPGTGKSTTAAYVFAKLKMNGVNAELVREYAKELAWAKIPITPDNQLSVFLTQREREVSLYGKVDMLVTDAPLAIQAFYARHFHAPDADEIERTVLTERDVPDVRHLDFWLVRSKEYNPAGRYQTEAEAREIDGLQRDYVEGLLGRHLPEVDTSERVLDTFSRWMAKGYYE